MLPTKPCKHCNEALPKHWPYQCRENKKTKRTIRQRSDKQIAYHEWLEQVARPTLIQRDGNKCSCCGIPAFEGQKLDIEHTLAVGSHAALKRNVNNMTLMCRYPCHRAKTNNVDCVH